MTERGTAKAWPAAGSGVVWDRHLPDQDELAVWLVQVVEL
jgi:hypothetical protein